MMYPFSLVRMHYQFSRRQFVQFRLRRDLKNRPIIQHTKYVLNPSVVSLYRVQIRFHWSKCDILSVPVTLKMKPRTPKPYHLVHVSQWFIHASLNPQISLLDRPQTRNYANINSNANANLTGCAWKAIMSPLPHFCWWTKYITLDIIRSIITTFPCQQHQFENIISNICHWVICDYPTHFYMLISQKIAVSPRNEVCCDKVDS